MGADLKDDMPVDSVQFDTKNNLWTVRITDREISFKARVLFH